LTEKEIEKMKNRSEGQQQRWAVPGAREAARKAWKQRNAKAMTQKEAVAAYGGSTRAMGRLERIKREATPALIAAVGRGEISAHAAERMLPLPPADQDELAARPERVKRLMPTIALKLTRLKLAEVDDDASGWTERLNTAWGREGAMEAREIFAAAPKQAREAFLRSLRGKTTSRPRAKPNASGRAK
jgi:hypothetical protein